MKKVYLAGKIKPNDWRNQFFDMRDSFFACDVNGKKENLLNSLEYYKNDIYINGPFFLSCDHSCYHGPESHGMRGSCYGERSFTEKDVNYICLKQIENCDILFAYINDKTCYGTLSEIGYAKALGKKILLLFDDGKLLKEMWFIKQMADEVEYMNFYIHNKVLHKEELKVKDIFDKMIDKYV